MSDRTEKFLEKTDIRTLWSETLIDILCDAVEHNWSQNALREIFRELSAKGIKPSKTLKIIEKKFGAETASKIKKQVSGK